MEKPQANQDSANTEANTSEQNTNKPDLVVIDLDSDPNVITGSIYDLLITEILNNDIDGKQLKTVTGSRLNDKQQLLLCRLIIKHSMPIFENHLTTLNFIGFCKAIQLHFSKEKFGTYFIPYDKESGPQSGRLWNAFNNYKKSHALTRAAKIKESEESEKIDKNSATVVDDSSVERDLKWLESNVSPWEEVLRAWNNTYDARMQLKKPKDKIYVYYKTFAPLRYEPTGLELFASDFEKDHPGKSNSISLKWKVFTDRIVPILESSKLNTKANGLLQALSNLEPENKVLPIIILLCNIIPPAFVNCVKRDSSGVEKTTKRKPSTEEIQESFFLNILNSSDVSTLVKKRTDKLYEAGLTLQPTPVFVGPITKIEFSYVLIDGVLYQCASVAEAIQSAFHAFYALKANYPADATNVWTFIQLYFFDIMHLNSSGKPAVRLISLINELTQEP